MYGETVFFSDCRTKHVTNTLYKRTTKFRLDVWSSWYNVYHYVWQCYIRYGGRPIVSIIIDTKLDIRQASIQRGVGEGLQPPQTEILKKFTDYMDTMI